MTLFGGSISEIFSNLLPVIIIGLVLWFVWRMIADKIPKFGRKGVKPLEDLPRDALDRVRRDLKKSAKLSKPWHLKTVRLSGDKETPPIKLGRIWGYLPRLDYRVIFYFPTGKWFMKTLLVENEFCCDSHSSELIVRGRGINIQGILFQFVEPVRHWREYLPIDADTEVDALRRLYLRRIGSIQVMVEKQSFIDRIETRAYLELKSVLPKVKIQDIMMRGSRWVDKAEGQEDW